MKLFGKLLVLAVITLLPVAAKAQTTTNIAVRWTLTTLNSGTPVATNNTTAALDYSVRKDATRIDGIVFAYNIYVATFAGTTNTPVNFLNWTKLNYANLIDSYAAQKQIADNQTLLSKLTSLLTQNADLLSTNDLGQLSTIADKAP